MMTEKFSPSSEPPGPSPDAAAMSPATVDTSAYPPLIETTPPIAPGAEAPRLAAADTVAETVSRIGRYPIFGEVGHGGMGHVFRGRDPELGRELAIKVLRPEHQIQPEMVRRFLDEARVGGGLQHPGVVPVYELGHAPADGTETPRPYFTMKLIEGRTLAALLAQRREATQDWPRFLKIFEQVCQTLAYAHARGVLHRDLKPANIMVGAFGEVQVMDWGLAKVLTGSTDAAAGAVESPVRPEDHAFTQAGTIMGTPGYMPPEQARAEPLDARSDVFSLGAILCEILTGGPPYAGSDGWKILAQAQRGDLSEAFTRLDDCGADADLVRLAKECLAPQPTDRPSHAGVVAERMTAYLAAVQERLRAAELERAAAPAREEEARAKAAAERRARRLTATLAAVILLAILAGAAGALIFQLDRSARAAQEMARQAEEARKESETAQAISHNLDQARAELDLGRHGAALVAARKAEGLLSAGGESLRPRVEEMLADLDMLDRLDRISVKMGELLPNESGFDSRPFLPLYQQAFEQYGIPATTLEISEAAERIRKRAIRIQLVAALDQWAIFAPDAATRRHLLMIAQQADPDPPGRPLRCGRR